MAQPSFEVSESPSRREPDETEAALRAAASCEPGNADAYHRLGEALEAVGNPWEARAAFRQAVALDPKRAAAHLGLARISMLVGDYATGWAEREWRLGAPGVVPDPGAVGVPIWDGADPAGRTILVQCEPRLDDCIQFARYLPLLSGRRADVVLVCQPPLTRLLGRMPGVRTVAETDAIPFADARVHLGSLPRLFDTTPATVPTFASYLRPAAPLVASWRNRFQMTHAAVPRPRLVGLACHATGSPGEDGVAPASARIHADLAPLANVAGVRWVAVEPAPASFVSAATRGDADVIDVAPKFDDLADTAAVIVQLDLVIAAGDSVVAHLAGALGKPVWTLVRSPADWRWSLAGDDTPWYPSMRMLRQSPDGDWSDAIDAAVRALRAGQPASPAALAA